jgi:hypothetical protein
VGSGQPLPIFILTLASIEVLQDAVYKVFGLTLGTSAITYAASAPIADRLALAKALLPPSYTISKNENLSCL